LIVQIKIFTAYSFGNKAFLIRVITFSVRFFTYTSHKLQLQVKFELKVNNELIEKYVADFTYYDKQGNYIVEDTKGFKTADYKRKKKWMKSVHGIEIKEN